MSPPKRAQRAADPASARIAAVALELFARSGFAGTSTHAIAHAACATQGLIRHHFGSKEGLWRMVVERRLAEFAADLAAARSLAAESVPLQVPALARLLAQHRSLLQLLVHALFEPGERRAWLVSEQLVPLWSRLRVELHDPAAGAWSGSRPDELAQALWLAACCTFPLFEAAFEARVEPGRGHALLSAWRPTSTTGAWVGPWSTAAARQRNPSR